MEDSCCASVTRFWGEFLRCAFWIWIDASANDAPWMDAVSATVPKRRLVTRSCSSPCCRSAGSYGKVTRRQRIKPPQPSIRRHFIINLGSLRVISTIHWVTIPPCALCGGFGQPVHVCYTDVELSGTVRTHDLQHFLCGTFW